MDASAGLKQITEQLKGAGAELRSHEQNAQRVAEDRLTVALCEYVYKPSKFLYGGLVNLIVTVAVVRRGEPIDGTEDEERAQRKASRKFDADLLDAVAEALDHQDTDAGRRGAVAKLRAALDRLETDADEFRADDGADAAYRDAVEMGLV